MGLCCKTAKALNYIQQYIYMLNLFLQIIPLNLSLIYGNGPFNGKKIGKQVVQHRPSLLELSNQIEDLRVSVNDHCEELIKI